MSRRFCASLVFAAAAAACVPSVLRSDEAEDARGKLEAAGGYVKENFAEKDPRGEMLSVTYGPFDVRQLDALDKATAITGVEFVNIAGGPFADATLEKLAKIERLTAAVVESRRFTSDGVQKLAALKRLRHLKTWTGEGAFDLSPFAACEELRHVEIVAPSIDVRAPATIAKLQHLEYFELTPLEPAAKEAEYDFTNVKGLAELAGVRLTGLKLKPGSTRAIAELPKLGSLALVACGIDGAELAPLAGKKLWTLDVSSDIGPIAGKFPSNRVTDEHLKALEGLDVQTLRLGGASLTKAGLASIATMKSLRNLELSYVKVDAEGIEALQKLTTLEDLSLWGSPALDEATLKAVAKLPALDQFSLMETTLSPEMIQALAEAPKLEYLGLHKAKVDRAAVEALKQARPELEIGGFR